MTLSLADIDRWDPATLRDVAAAATSRAESAAETALALATLPAFALWDGLAAAAAQASMAVTRTELDAHAEEARTVARVVTHAADEIDALKADLHRLDDDAHRAHLDIDRDSATLVPAPGFPGGPAGSGPESGRLAARLAEIIDRADRVDAELAQAIALAGRLPTPSPPPPQAARVSHCRPRPSPTGGTR